MKQRSNIHRPAEERILVVRFSSLGDLLLTAPVLRNLRARFPQADIDLLVRADFADAARLLSGANRILTYDRASGFPGLLRLRRELSGKYSVFIDLQNSLRSFFLRVFTFPGNRFVAKRYRLRRWLLIHFKWNTYRGPQSVALRYLDAVLPLGVQTDGLGLNLEIPTEASGWLSNLNLEENTIVLCPGARHFTKRWPAERWMNVGQILNAKGWQIVIAGAADEKNLLSEIAAAIPHAIVVWNRSISQIAALFKRARAVISQDSGLMHVAAGVGVPAIAIFGPTVEPFGFFPFRAKTKIIEHSLACRPCSAMGSSRCPKQHFKCMLETTAEYVCQSLETIADKV